MPEIHLSLSLPFIVILIAAVASLGLSLLVYRITIPPIARSIRVALIAFRAVGLFLLLVLIGEPLFSLLTRNVEPPIVALLIDNSKSMTIKDKGGDRKDLLTRTLRSPSIHQLKSSASVRYGLFDGKTHFLNSYSDDSLSLTGDLTDIGQALKAVRQAAISSNIQSVLLLTDGISTTGTNPQYDAEELGLPVFTVGIGDTSEQKDVLIRKVVTNQITYVNNRVPVNVTVRSAGYDGERVEVTLQEGGNTLDRKTLTVEKGTREYLVPLSFIPEKEGTQKLGVEVSRLPNELTEQNNRSNFFIKVLKSKMSVVLIGGGPSPDIAFVRRVLEADQNIELKTFTERGNGQFYEGMLSRQLLDQADCLALIGYPTPTSAVGTLRSILNALESSKPLFSVLGRTVDAGKLQSLEPSLPFTTVQPTANELQVFVTIPESQHSNPLFKTSSGVSVSPIEAWAKLPPIFRSQASFRAKPESEILGFVRIQSIPLSEPLIVSRNVNKKKSVAVLGYGIWRWKMLSDPGGPTERLAEDFISNSMRWLTTREDDRRIRVQTSRQIFTPQDPVDFTAQVYDENYQPIDDAQISITVSRGEQTTELLLTSLGSGQYEGSLDQLPEGEYRFVARVSANRKALGDDKGTFSVGGLNIEFQDTRMNKHLLQQIAARTGGKYYDFSNLDGLSHDIASIPQFKSRTLSRAQEFELWNSPWMLGLVVVIFALEWFLRKRSGML